VARCPFFPPFLLPPVLCCFCPLPVGLGEALGDEDLWVVEEGREGGREGGASGMRGGGGEREEVGLLYVVVGRVRGRREGARGGKEGGREIDIAYYIKPRGAGTKERENERVKEREDEKEAERGKRQRERRRMEEKRERERARDKEKESKRETRKREREKERERKREEGMRETLLYLLLSSHTITQCTQKEERLIF